MTGYAYKVLHVLSGGCITFATIIERTGISGQHVSVALAALSRDDLAQGDDVGWWTTDTGREALAKERAAREKGYYWRLAWATGEMWFESRAEALASATALPEGLSCSVTQMTITRAQYASRRRNAGQLV